MYIEERIENLEKKFDKLVDVVEGLKDLIKEGKE